jgi:hypothetical protein
MTAVVGRRVPSFSSLVEVLLEGGDAQKAAFSFCEKVLLQKEKAERIRREEVPAPPAPSQDGGGSRRGGRNPPRPP